jgi:hypothetical protein
MTEAVMTVTRVSGNQYGGSARGQKVIQTTISAWQTPEVAKKIAAAKAPSKPAQQTSGPLTEAQVEKLGEAWNSPLPRDTARAVMDLNFALRRCG